MPQPLTPITYATLCSLFAHQLTVSIHTILAARAIYPENTFLTAKAYNLPIKQSRHPGVCTWINDAVDAVEAELLKGLVNRVVLVIFSPGQSSSETVAAAQPDKENQQLGQNGSISSKQKSDTSSKDTKSKVATNQPLERYIWDVSRLPSVPNHEIDTPLVREDHVQANSESATEGPQQGDNSATKPAAFKASLEKAHIDMQEQFRGLISRLSTISSSLKPLPPACTYTLCIELKDEQDPPIGHPQPWIPSEPVLQRTILHGEAGDIHDNNGEDTSTREGPHRKLKQGSAIGGVKTTPIRSIDANEMVFEVWIEEGSAKFG